MTTNRGALAGLLCLGLAACGGAKGAAGGGVTTAGGGSPGSKKPMSSIAADAPPPPQVTAPAKPPGEVSEGERAKWEKVQAAYVEVAKKAETGGWTSSLCGEAAQVWEGLASANPKMVEARFNVGAAWSNCHDDKRAESAYNDTLKIQAYAPALANMGEIYLRGHNEQRAKEWFDKALQVDPNNAAAHNNLAFMTYQKLHASTNEAEGDRLESEAIDHLRRALAVEAENIQAFNTFALIYLEGSEKNSSRLDLSQLLIDQAKKKNDKFAPLYVTSAMLALRRKDVSRAISDLNKAVALNPMLIEARMNLGSLDLSFRKYDDAKEQFEAALKKEPKNYDAKIGLGVALRGQAALRKDKAALDAAEKAYNEAREMQPNNGAAYFNLGLIWQDYKFLTIGADNYDEQISALKQARTYFDQFVAKSAQSGPAESVAEAKHRLEDITKTIAGIEEAKKYPAEPPPAPEAPAAPAAPAPATPPATPPGK